MATSTVEVVTAVAAIAAAGISLVTLGLSGVRDQRKWRREALTEALFEYMTTSFASPSESGRQARAAGQPMHDFAATAKEMHNRQNVARTRIRLLAPRRVIKAADRLHLLDESVRSAAVNGPELSDASWNKLRLDQKEARNKLVNKARWSLGLLPGRSVDYR